MPRSSQRYPTGIQLEKGEKLNENNAVSKVSNYFPIIEGENGEKTVSAHSRGTHREVGSELDTSDTGLQIWKPGERAQVGHPKPAKRFVQLNDVGHIIGEDHPGAKLSDEDVEAIRDEYEAGLDGTGPRIGYMRLAKKWGTSKSTIRGILTYQKRNQWLARWHTRR